MITIINNNKKLTVVSSSNLDHKITRLTDDGKRYYDQHPEALQKEKELFNHVILYKGVTQ